MVDINPVMGIYFELVFYVLGWVFVTIAVGSTLLFLWLRPQYVDPSVPGPRRHPLLGVTFGDTKDYMDGVDFSWPRWPTLSIVLSRNWKFQTWGGPTINLGFGGAFFNVVSPKCLEYILRENFENYEKGKLSRSFQELMGQDFAFTTDGDLWKFHRKITVALLNRKTVQHGVSVLHDKLLAVEKLIDDEAGGIFDFQKMAYELIMETFVKIGFGLDLNGMGNKNNSSFAQALDELQSLIHQRFDDFFWEIKQRFAIGKREQRIKVLTKVIDKFAEEIIQAVKDQEKMDRPDMVSRYLEYCKSQKQPTPTGRQLRNFVIGFVFAGRDSTSAALTWALYETTKHPHVAARIRQEVNTVSHDRSLTLEMIQSMPYLHATIMESLRLHPSAPENFRFAIKDDILPDGTKIPARSLVMYSINTINHNDNVWEDPELFRPERFFGEKEPSPFSFATFNGGPRTCPGKSLALMELKMSLAFLLRRYDFEDATGHDGDYQWTTVMSMRGGFAVRAKRVEEAS